MFRIVQCTQCIRIFCNVFFRIILGHRIVQRAIDNAGNHLHSRFGLYLIGNGIYRTAGYGYLRCRKRFEFERLHGNQSRAADIHGAVHPLHSDIAVHVFNRYGEASVCLCREYEMEIFWFLTQCHGYSVFRIDFDCLR